MESLERYIPSKRHTFVFREGTCNLCRLQRARRAQEQHRALLLQQPVQVGQEPHRRASTGLYRSHAIRGLKWVVVDTHAHGCIALPILQEVNVADHVGLTLLSNTGRCGSTLLLQLFESLPQAASINEPEVILQLADNPNDYGDHRYIHG